MNAWLQLVRKLKPGCAVVVQHVQGAKFPDRVLTHSSAVGEHHIMLQGGCYSLRNGWHVYGERRIIEVVDDTPPKPKHVPNARERLIAKLARPRPQMPA